jgi:hypothetical protein
MAQAVRPRWSLESELLRTHYQALFASSGAIVSYLREAQVE